MNEHMEVNKQLLRMRILVGFLGEKPQFSWWDTNFLSTTGQKFLEITCPRTAFSAGCHSVFDAAARLHDARIGKGRVYHLFRLPPEVEEGLHRLLMGDEPSVSSCAAKETALKDLRAMATGGVSAPEGPVQIGTVKNMLTEFAIEELAQHYADAFMKENQTFPYFAA